MKLLLLIPFLFCGCSTLTPNAATNARNAGLNAAGGAALQDASRLLGQFAVNSLMMAVAKDTKGNSNPAVTSLEQSGVQALYGVTGSGGVDLSNIFTQFSAGKATQTAVELQKIQAKAGSSPAVAQAAAAVISTATGAPPAK